MSRAVARAFALGIGLGAAVGFLAACERPEAVALPEEDRLLEEIMETYVSERVAFYPVESTLAGLPGNDERLGDYAESEMNARVAWLIDFRQKLMGVRLTELSQPAYLDALWLTNLVKAELFDLEQRRLWRRTASFYGDQVRLGLVALLVDGDLASRADALLGRLRSIPLFLDVARANLGPSHALWRSDGASSLDACRLLLRDLPEMLEGRLPTHRDAELAELSRLATRATEDLLAAVPELQAGGLQPSYVMGEEGLERHFLYASMVDWPIDEILTAAERELDDVTDEMTELALREFPAQPLAALLATRSTTESIEMEVASAERRVIEFLRGRDGSVSLDNEVPVRRVPIYFPGSEPVQLWRPKALEPTRGAFLMVRDVARPDAVELELLTLRELGGRARQYAVQSEARSLLRRVFAARTTREGWLALFERNALDEGFRENSAGLRLEHQRRAILDLVRLVGVVRLHARGAELADVVALFQERAMLSLAVARAEALRVAVDPGVSQAALGRLLVNELSAEYFDRNPLAVPAELEASLLSGGVLPIRLARFRMFHRSSARTEND